MRTRALAPSLLIPALLLAGCSIANPTSSEVSLQYGAGPFDSRKFVECETARDVSDVNDDHYYYPSGQRDFTFGDGEGLDAAALTSTTQDSQEIKVTGTVKFTLNTDCAQFTDPTGKVWPGGKLQMFHELIAYKYEAAPTDGGEQMEEGWSELLRNYVGAALDRATDNEALKYPWQKLYTDTAAKAQWEKDVLEQLPDILRSLTQGVDLITINSVLLQKPGIQAALVQGLTEKQAAELRGQAVEVDKQAAASFPGGIVAYQQYQQQQAVNQAIKDGKVQVLPVPQGSPVIVSPTK
ncbi:SPFH domain-containing protein [Actinokineospora spheciospongiae]|uniref:SPFH domain-containing protein n=1 Tax=Actinokineospora spheciospongiae TaxID=909613 RepID=UPI000D711760|nr:SPFH domain-containing protein [Actinokineospora spheciospongiae]PWW63216.1 SPFH domain/Band 7 family protein [Actinokineospora spheciospongiae]